MSRDRVENLLSPTAARSGWQAQDSMPLSQEQRLLLLVTRPQDLHPVQSLAAPSPTPPLQTSPERQPRPTRRAPANRKSEHQSAPKPTPPMAQSLVSARPALPFGRTESPIPSSPQIRVPSNRRVHEPAPVAEKRARLRASRATPPSPPGPPGPPRPRTHRQQCSVPSEPESRTSPRHHTGPNGARTTRTYRRARRPGR